MQIYLLLTEKCNLKCRMCIRGKQKGENISFSQLKNATWVNEIQTHDIVVSGGEPTLHPDFTEIVNFLCNHARSVTITSNGTQQNHLTTNVSRENLYFQISVDGDKVAHDDIRGEGTFSKCMSTVFELDRLGARYSIASVASRKNISSFKKLALELETLRNIRYWRISYEMPFGNAGFSNMMSADEWNAFVDEILETANLRVHIQKIFPFEIYDRRKEELDRIIENGEGCNNCGSGKSKIYIYPDFNVYPCTCLTDFPLGNLKTQSLEEILHNSNTRKFSEYEIKNKICLECKYLKYCNGGCIGMSYHFFKSLGMGDVRCPKLSGLKELR